MNGLGHGWVATENKVRRLETILTGFEVNVMSYGATGDGSTDDTTAINNALAAVSGGGTVYLPTGTYKTTSTLNMNTGIRLIGASRYNTKITNAASNVFSFPSGNIHFWEIAHITAVVTGAGFHIFNPGAGQNLNAFHIHDCSFQALTNTSCIWKQTAGQIVEMYIDYCDLYVDGSSGVGRTVPAFSLDDPVGWNANVIEKCVCTNNTPALGGSYANNTQYFFNWVASVSGNPSINNVFRDIIFETPAGGMFSFQSQYDLQLEDCWEYDDASSGIKNDLISIGKSAAAPASRGTRIINCGRTKNTGLNTGVYDITLAATTTDTAIIGFRGSGGDNGQFNLNGSVPVALIGNSQGTTITNGTGTVQQFWGSGAPSTQAFIARVGDTYFRQDGGAGTYIYRCTVAGTPGTWVATAA